MKHSYKKRIFFWFSFIFVLFTAGVLFFEQSRERAFRTDTLREKLETYTDVVNAALSRKPDSVCHEAMDSLHRLFPDKLRISLINRRGEVLYDNSVEDVGSLENHLQRPEVIQAEREGSGSEIRLSASNGETYLYYAKKHGTRYIRVAMPYDIQVRQFLQTDNLFLYFILALFAVILLLTNIVSNRFGQSIRRLRDFALSTEKKEGNIPDIRFPKDELGEIGGQILRNYRRMKAGIKKAEQERLKLLQHVYSSEEGLCFFSAGKKVEFYNGLFIRYLNLLVDGAGDNPATLFDHPTFETVNRFLEQHGEAVYHESTLHSQGKSFSVRVNIFDDHTFEVVLNDITKQEKTRQMKQEMTGNIAHELRTPVTVVRGYLETLLEQPLTPEQCKHFTRRAYEQTLTLSELIQDIGLITKIEEAPQQFPMEEVDLNRLLAALKRDLEPMLIDRKVDFAWEIPEHTAVRGNPNLLYSIFRNLTDNVLRYAGEGVQVRVHLYNQDADFYYIDYYDTGAGIPDESHLSRLFERFYRISEGRTRDTGGSGLGLSIVKNAVAFHKGSIAAKNRTGGGLEFLFQLHK